MRDHRRTACLASHAIGKTHVAENICNWWYDCWDEHIAYITAPTWGQALGLTFKYIKRRRLKRRLPGDILETGLVRDPNRLKATAHYIEAKNAATGEGFQGEHSAPILIVMEEAVGIPIHIWEAVDGLMTHPDCRVLMIANPTNESTQFGRMVKSGLCNVLRVSAMDHVNIAAELACTPPPFPDAVRLHWLYDMLKKEAEPADTPSDGESFEYWALSVLEACLQGTPVPQNAPRCWYRPTASFEGRVIGRFPTQADSQVIPRGWLEACPVLEPEGKPEIGCDVARHGSDRTAICTRSGPVVWRLKAIRHMDNLQVTAALMEAADDAARWHNGRLPESLSAEERAKAACDPKKIPIRIDVTGGLGTGPYDILRKKGYNAIPVNASSKPQDQEQFKNKRSEMWWMTRLRVREKRLDLSRLPKGLSEPVNRDLVVDELCAPTYEIDGAGRKVICPKDEMKEELGFSPDLADALNLAFTDTGQWWKDPEIRAFLAKRHGAQPPEGDEATPEVPDAPRKKTGLAAIQAMQQELHDRTGYPT